MAQDVYERLKEYAEKNHGVKAVKFTWAQIEPDIKKLGGDAIVLPPQPLIC
jgi:hypothetical protein